MGLQAAAEFLGLTVAALRKWREKGAMPFPVYAIFDGQAVGGRLMGSNPCSCQCSRSSRA